MKIKSDPAVLTIEEEDKDSSVTKLALTLLEQLLHDMLIMIGRFHLLCHVRSGILQVFCVITTDD